MNDRSASGAHSIRTLNLIGYWAPSEQRAASRWPDPRDLVGVWDGADKPWVIAYLSTGIVFRKYCGFASCRICQKTLGSTEMTDGVWAWPAQLEHYIQAHDVQLPKDFIESARARGWKMPQHLREEFASPELWMDTERGPMPADPAQRRTVMLQGAAWMDWAAATIGPRPAPDAITFDEAKALCARLSHRLWKAFIEERFGRWRVVCRSGNRESLMYVEQCPAEILQRRLVEWRNPDPDALLDPEQAVNIAAEYDGPWGAARPVAAAEDRWLVWVKPPGCDWPSSREIDEATKGAEFGWSRFRPDGPKSFICPRLDELQWRKLLEEERAEPPRPRATPQGGQSEGGPRVEAASPSMRMQSRLRVLWNRFRSFWSG